MTAAPRGRRGRGGQGGHEPRGRIRTREFRVLELTVLGWSQQRIAGDLGVSQGAVSKIQKRLELRALGELVATSDRQKIRQTWRLEHLFGEAMHAWDDSKADSTRRRQRKSASGSGGGTASIAEVVIENQHGDPRYLDEARKILADQRKLWGLDAPQKLDLRASRNPYDGLTEDALREALDQQSHLLDAGAPADAADVEHTKAGDHVDD